MSSLEAQLEEIMATDPGKLRDWGRALVRRGDFDALSKAIPWLRNHNAHPWAACFSFWAKELEAGRDQYESWLRSAEAPAAFHLAQLCRIHQKLGDADGVFRTAARFHPWDLDVESWMTAGRALEKLQGGNQALPIWIVSSFAAPSLLTCLRVGAARLDLNLDATLYSFAEVRAKMKQKQTPQVVFVAHTWRDLQPDRSASEQAAEWQQLRSLLLNQTGAQIVEHTFDRPPFTAGGNLDAADDQSLRNIAPAINVILTRNLPPRVSIVDYEQIVLQNGARDWNSERGWYWTKSALSEEAAPILAEEYTAILRALTGRTKKVLVMDLDNTLWGGTVGEDGVEGLSIGPPSPEGEAYQGLQRYCRALKNRGVLLAVCSKNNPDDARKPFEAIPEMVLHADDFVSFEADWTPKPDRLRALAKKLNVGLDSFVFLDDDPRERAQVRLHCPEVQVVPLSEKPYEYTRILHEARAFESLSISEDDRKRTGDYQAQVKREKSQEASGSLEDYYRSLEMVATLHPFRTEDLSRIVQLAGKTNQFNLTTWRMTQAEAENVMNSSQHVTCSIRLRDRFGDYGLISAVVGEIKEKRLEIVQWFMSCRAIGKTVEETALAEICRLALEKKCDELVGVYLPTPKNQVVADLFPRLGFESTGEGSRWKRSTKASPNELIRVESGQGGATV